MEQLCEKISLIIKLHVQFNETHPAEISYNLNQKRLADVIYIADVEKRSMAYTSFTALLLKTRLDLKKYIYQPARSSNIA